MDEKDEELTMNLYKSSNFTGGCLEIRLFYVRIAPCQVDSVPDHLNLRHIRSEIGVSLDINGCRVPATDTASINLRRDRVDRELTEVTYVSTENVRVSGAVEFEVRENEEELVLCGSLERLENAAWTNGSGLDGDSNSGWSMDCYTAVSLASGGSMLFNRRSGSCSPTIEVYIAGCCSGVPVILTKTIQVSPRRKVSRHKMLDAIPEEEEIGTELKHLNGLIRQRKMQITEMDMDSYELNGKAGSSLYSEDMYLDEDGQLSWFNAGVRVGVGIGLGMCVGVGIGVGLLMRSYQATTRNFRRRFF